MASLTIMLSRGRPIKYNDISLLSYTRLECRSEPIYLHNYMLRDKAPERSRDADYHFRGVLTIDMPEIFSSFQ